MCLVFASVFNKTQRSKGHALAGNPRSLLKLPNVSLDILALYRHLPLNVPISHGSQVVCNGVAKVIAKRWCAVKVAYGVHA